VVADELLTTADAVNIHGIVIGLLVGAREALGAPGEREDGGVALGLDGDLPGLVLILGSAGADMNMMTTRRMMTTAMALRVLRLVALSFIL